MTTIKDLEGAVSLPYSYTPLPNQSSEQPPQQSKTWKPSRTLVYTLVSCISLVCIVMVSMSSTPTTNQGLQNQDRKSSTPASSASIRPQISRGVSEGVSEKAFRLLAGQEEDSFPWSNSMLSWQRTAFHFQPEKNWMNDPNGPLFYKGWYHLFYQYNPNGAVWGDIVWGHSVSKDLMNWEHLPLAMVADHWYDIDGVWTGSATILPDGSIVMLYTGSTKEKVQVQNLAYPADPSDPLLIKWKKHTANPVLVPPPGIGVKDFRDPTTAWKAPNGNWRITIGSKINKTGISMVYETKDFINYTLLKDFLHEVPGTGMWECIDFYPISLSEENGLDTSENGAGVKHVLKASLDDDKKDYYALGTYDPYKNVWTPDNPELDVGIGLRYDWGKFYASKTFYDQNKKRRILWGWIGETDSEAADVMKGWASVQGVPREVLFDKKTKTNILQRPVKEVEMFRLGKTEVSRMVLDKGAVIMLDVGTATQLDITADFEVDEKALKGVLEADVGYNCSTSNGAAGRGALGPFGLLVLADNSRSEQTAVYFYIAKGTDGNLKTFFCTDESRASKANDVGKQIYGYTVPVLRGEKFSVRILVDHSIVEAFAQGGRTCITSRVYPTQAIGGGAKLYLFNNATSSSVTASSVKVWQMGAATSASASAATLVSQPGMLKVE